MIYTKKIKDAIRFSIKTHEVYQKQKRKGKDVAYITHPLTAGIILSLAGAYEDTVVAGILHDTIEDSISEKKVSREMIAEDFGENVADLVYSVTEHNKELPWEERKRDALEHISVASHDSLLVKSADVISNVSEIISDYREHGEEVFKRFTRSKEKTLKSYTAVMEEIMKAWPENPLFTDWE